MAAVRNFRHGAIVISVVLLHLVTFKASMQEGIPSSPVIFHDGLSVWQVDLQNSEAQVIFSLEDLPPRSVTTLSEDEYAVLHDLTAPYDLSPQYLSSFIKDALLLPDDTLLLLVEFQFCTHFATGSLPCAGYSEILHTDEDTIPEALFQLDYHYQPAMAAMDCSRGHYAEPMEINANADHSQIVLMLGRTHFQCDEANRWGLLIDTASGTFTDLLLSRAFAWSPSGTQLAFIDMRDCRTSRLCPQSIGIYDQSGSRFLPLIHDQPEDYVANYDGLVWIDENTLLFQQSIYPNIPGGDPAADISLVWYDLTTQESVSYPLEKTQLYPFGFEDIHRLEGENPLLVGWTSQHREPHKIIFFASSPPFEVIDALDGTPLGFTILGDYAVISTDSSIGLPKSPETIFLLDSQGNRFDYSRIESLLQP